MAKYSERTYRRIWKQTIEAVLDWFIFSDEPAPDSWRKADPWKQSVMYLEGLNDRNQA